MSLGHLQYKFNFFIDIKMMEGDIFQSSKKCYKFENIFYYIYIYFQYRVTMIIAIQ